ncbi:flagellar hook-associated protein FlgK [Stieleria varia]|uniref:Flagellar hook-associated protein 1 n=1 Tax=Stieleria varia TaxID=2528005 RepID=A0A5C6ARQ3_9BACT|nr:flagellar hook-associated protein FlgK [Stieleria varia]TWU02380.1 Flagellar hook-associated protein 1 [Stieleria varia]
MPNFALGLSSLRANQFALNVVANNIANAGTEGYHRRNVHFQQLRANEYGEFRIGTGVSINYIERVRDQVTEASLTNVISDLSNVDQLLQVERQVEVTLLSGNNSINSELDQFFGEVSRLTSSPDEPAQRTAVIETGQRLAGVIRTAATQLDQLRNAVQFQIQEEITALNQDMATLNEINIEIRSFTARRADPNTELDQRDALLNRIAESVGITRNDHVGGELNLMIGNASIQQANHASEFHLSETETGELVVLLDDSDRATDLGSGRLAALLEVYNSTIPKYQEKLDTIAGELIRNVDQVHATGIGTAGSFQSLLGSRVVDQSDIPLDDAGPVFPIASGELTISIVQPDGKRRTEIITIDPTVDSLDDVAARLSAIPNLRAEVEAEYSQLRIFAEAGYKFDFTGNVQTEPDLTAFSGTSVPTFAGQYTGPVNETLSFEIEGTGDVGISDDLFLNVYSESGTLKQQINIGQGYEAGTPLDIGDGIEIQLSRGTVADGDAFSSRVTANPDETGILAALGLNSFFQGVNATTIDVSNEVQSNSARLAMGKTGDPADTNNLFNVIDLEQYKGMPGNLTFTQYINEINVEIGFEINTNVSLSTSLSSLKLRLEQDRDSYSGVDLNEEIVYLQQFQKSYEAATRVIQAADQILDDLFSILR